MGFVRVWWPPVVVGAVVALLGIGIAEVAGMPAASAPAAAPASAGPQRPPSVQPAAIEHDEVAVGAGPATAVAPPVTSSPRSTPQSSVNARARVTPSPTQTPTATPMPTQTATSAPTRTPRRPPVPRVTPTAVAAPRPTQVPTQVPTQAPTVTPRPPATPVPPPGRVGPIVQPKPKPVRLARVLDLRRWKLTLPAGRRHHPTEIRQPMLSSLASGPFVRLTPDRGVAFRAPVGGVTTRNSSYPRSELREMSGDGRNEAGWTNATGTHVMTINQAITATPRAKPHVVTGQIHDTEDDVVMIRLEGRRLFAESDGDDVGLLDPNYRLGTRFTVSIVATRRGVDVIYNGRRTVHLSKVGRGWYFKAGCYPQSNPDRGDRPTAYGEVVIYALTVRHSAS